MNNTAAMGHLSALKSFPPPRRVKPLTGLLLLPSLLFLTAFFLVPAGMMFSSSILTQGSDGSIAGPVTMQHFVRLFTTPLYADVLLSTIRIAVVTSILSIALGYPVALMITRGSRFVSSLATIIVVAPLVVSVIVRTYGLMLLFANNNSGVVNWILYQLGFGNGVLKVLYTEMAVVIGSLHVYLPMMVLPLASALARINPSVEEAARTLGAGSFRVFFLVTAPLSTPGLIAGITMVFSLTAASFVTPAILGGNSGLMLGNLLEQQVMVVYDWTFGAAIAVVMVVMTFVINGLSVRLVESFKRSRFKLAEA